jgi:hypothetical protein
VSADTAPVTAATADILQTSSSPPLEAPSSLTTAKAMLNFVPSTPMRNASTGVARNSSAATSSPLNSPDAGVDGVADPERVELTEYWDDQACIAGKDGDASIYTPANSLPASSDDDRGASD